MRAWMGRRSNGRFAASRSGVATAALLASAGAAWAQTEVTVDGSTPTTLSVTGDVTTIDGGRIAGANQFHSFGRFGVDAGRTVDFTHSGPGAISNVIGRVTGGDPSAIDGTLQVSVPNANLFLINPNGVIFGDDAVVDAPGAAHFSDGASLLFHDGAVFSAVDPDAGGFTVAAPEAFGFLDGGAPLAAVLDGSTPSILTIQEGDGTVRGGARAGANLYHSFDTLSVGAGRGLLLTTAAPSGADALSALVARVTGGAETVLEGTLAVDGLDADLYLANPAGIAIVEGAALETPGVSVVSAAAGIAFEGGDRLTASADDVAFSAQAPTLVVAPEGAVGDIRFVGDLETDAPFAPGRSSFIGADIDITPGFALDAASTASEAAILTEDSRGEPQPLGINLIAAGAGPIEVDPVFGAFVGDAAGAFRMDDAEIDSFRALENDAATGALGVRVFAGEIDVSNAAIALGGLRARPNRGGVAGSLDPLDAPFTPSTDPSIGLQLLAEGDVTIRDTRIDAYVGPSAVSPGVYIQSRTGLTAISAMDYLGGRQPTDDPFAFVSSDFGNGDLQILGDVVDVRDSRLAFDVNENFFRSIVGSRDGEADLGDFRITANTGVRLYDSAFSTGTANDTGARTGGIFVRGGPSDETESFIDVRRSGFATLTNLLDLAPPSQNLLLVGAIDFSADRVRLVDSLSLTGVFAANELGGSDEITPVTGLSVRSDDIFIGREDLNLATLTNVPEISLTAPLDATPLFRTPGLFFAFTGAAENTLNFSPNLSGRTRNADGDFTGVARLADVSFLSSGSETGRAPIVTLDTGDIFIENAALVTDGAQALLNLSAANTLDISNSEITATADLTPRLEDLGGQLGLSLEGRDIFIRESLINVTAVDAFLPPVVFDAGETLTVERSSILAASTREAVPLQFRAGQALSLIEADILTEVLGDLGLGQPATTSTLVLDAPSVQIVDTRVIGGTQGTGASGPVTITGGRILITGEETLIQTNSTGASAGPAGDVLILSGAFAPDGSILPSGAIEVSDGARIETNSSSLNAGGSIEIFGETIRLVDGAEVRAQALGERNAGGSIVIATGGAVEIADGVSITTSAQSGQAGGIGVFQGEDEPLTLREAAIVTSNLSGEDTGGRIVIGPAGAGQDPLPAVILIGTRLEALGGIDEALLSVNADVLLADIASTIAIDGAVVAPETELNNDAERFVVAFLNVGDVLRNQCAGRRAGQASSFSYAEALGLRAASPGRRATAITPEFYAGSDVTVGAAYRAAGRRECGVRG